MPTPNGPLHLGHIGGPFLRMDVLARQLRQAGHKVSIVSASDPWETHVLLRAHGVDSAPADVCHRYHDEIAASLAALNIRYDRFIHVLDAPENEVMPRLAQRVIDRLAAHTGALRVINERFPYSIKYGVPIVGGLIEGRCPSCGSSMGGFFCERCGAESSPDKLLEPRSRLSDDRWEWRNADSLFLHVADVATMRATAERICQDGKLVDTAFRGLQLNENLIRLTHPGNWGIPCTAPGVSPGSVIFTYPALLALSLLCAGDMGHGEPAEGTAFEPDRDTVTIASFGVDNAMPYLVSVLGQAMSAGNIKPFDHYLTNYFGTLDGKKFSTSRNHAIWALDAQRLLQARTDTIRAYLALVNPQHGEEDFSVAEFGEFKLEWEDRLDALIDTARTARHVDSGTLDLARLSRLLEARDVALDPARFELSDAAKAVHEWIRAGASEGATQAWALGLSVLAYPIMPELAERIWQEDGMPGLPKFDALSQRLPA
ncbi:class I tRNA ligase family protein [Trinickia fusca]|nr:class I tRNA ligase family protein [Trinickia fusca]